MRLNWWKKTDASGFTLIELLAVIMIAGLLAAISVPTFTSILKGTALNTASNALTNTLSLARQLAITFRYVYRVELDDWLTNEDKTDEIDDSLQEQRYRIYRLDPNGNEIAVGKWHALPRSVEFDLPERKGPSGPIGPLRGIAFKPTGEANGFVRSGAQFSLSQAFGGCRFKILHRQSGEKGKEKTIEIQVDGLTGRVTSKAVQR